MQQFSQAVRIQATPGPWTIDRSFNGFRITRTWSDGWYQVLRTGYLRTIEEAQAVLAGVSS